MLKLIFESNPIFKNRYYLIYYKILKKFILCKVKFELKKKKQPKVIMGEPHPFDIGFQPKYNLNENCIKNWGFISDHLLGVSVALCSKCVLTAHSASQCLGSNPTHDIFLVWESLWVGFAEFLWFSLDTQFSLSS